MYWIWYFNNIQALQQQKHSSTIDKLIEAVETSFEELTLCKLNNVFLSLQAAMDDCILYNGGNDYRLRYLSKAKLEREGRLPCSISVSSDVMPLLSEREGPFMF
uniref:Uncharacterized protein n=1 Tax=Globisporangium ultimum (strain ATCC 200006 / CBS 805.95 / DAOM BR144) TaxID=431595 RepID=K3X5I3_GLOUD